MREKISYLKFKATLEKSGKTYFRLFELKKFYQGSKASLQVLLSHWSQNRWIHHIGRDIYSFEITNINHLQLANDLDRKSYISFEYALLFHHVIEQVPSVITCATTSHSHTILMQPWVFEYTKIKEDLFFGYEMKHNAYIASPEKALADLLYLLARGKRHFEWQSIDNKKINKKLLKKIMKKFPEYVQKKARELRWI